MPLKLFDKKDAIPEAQRDGAIETKDGKFAIVEETDHSDLQTSLVAEREKREAAEKLVKKTADELKKLETQKKAEKAGVSEEQLQQIRADVRKEVETELAPKLTAADEHAKENRTLKLDNQVKKLAADGGFLGERLDDFWKLYGGEFDLSTDGKPIVKDHPGVTPAKHIEGLTKKQPGWVQGTQAAGGGAAGITGGTTASTTATIDDVLKNPGQALQAARAAGKTE